MSVSRHTTYNLLGTLAPILVALISTPIYIHLIGDQRYGMLSIAWVLLGYFGVFDLGIGRAAAQRIAKIEKSHAAINKTFWTALFLNSLLGALGGLALWPAAHFFFSKQFQIDAQLQPEVLAAIPWLMLALPLATITSVLSGALQGVERFLHLNIINSTGSIIFQTFPLLAAWIWTPSLNVIMPAAIGSRIIGVAFLYAYCIKYVTVQSAPKFSKDEAVELMRYGGWITISSLISPIMVMADRFIIGAILGAKSVTIYTVPFQLAERSTIIPSALSSSLFPRFAKDNESNGEQVAITSIRILLVIMTPLTVTAILLAAPFLSFWISPQFSSQSTLVLQILLIGFWINGIARVPHAKLQASGRPNVVATFHILEVLPFLIVLYFSLEKGGITGASLAFSLRVFVDYLLLSGYARTLRPTILIMLSGMVFLAAALLISQHAYTTSTNLLVSFLLIALTLAWSVTQAPEALKRRAKIFCKRT